MNRIINIVLFVAIVFFGGYYIYFRMSAPEKGDLAPEIEATLTNGEAFKLSDYQGKYVLLDFWGSWCAPCRSELPYLVQLEHNFRDEMVVVSVALEKSPDNWIQIVEKFGMNWETQIVEESSIVMLSPIARTYGVSEIPTKFLISPDGELLGELSFDEIRERLTKDNH